MADQSNVGPTNTHLPSALRKMPNIVSGGLSFARMPTNLQQPPPAVLPPRVDGPSTGPTIPPPPIPGDDFTGTMLVPISELLKSSLQQLFLSTVQESVECIAPGGTRINAEEARAALRSFKDFYVNYLETGGPNGEPILTEPHLVTTIGKVSDVKHAVAPYSSPYRKELLRQEK